MSSTTSNPAAPAPARAARSNRPVALCVLLLCLTVLGMAAYLKPAGAGMGTHTQLGLPACGFLRATGLPCATCGYTTAFTLAARGQLAEAFVTQPAAALLAVAVAATAILCAWACVTGADIGPVFSFLWRPKNLILVAALVLGAWVYKIIVVCGPSA